MFIAISTTSSPTGSYYLYQIASCGPNYIGDTDQPRVGYSAQWLVLSVPCQSYDPNLTVITKSAAYSGLALVQNNNLWQFTDPINAQGSNRDNPVLTYYPSLAAADLVASGISGGNAAMIYSFVDGPPNAPLLYSGWLEVATSIPASAPVPVDSPGCQGCINTFTNGWVHSSSVWPLLDNQPCIVATVMLGDPTYPRATEVVQIALNTITDSAEALMLGTLAAGNGPLGSEIAMPLVPNKTSNTAILAWALAGPTRYPGLRVAEWNIDANTFKTLNPQSGSLTPTGFDGSRWIDFMDAIAPMIVSQRVVYERAALLR